MITHYTHIIRRDGLSYDNTLHCTHIIMNERIAVISIVVAFAPAVATDRFAPCRESRIRVLREETYSTAN